MALDGISISALVSELDSKLTGGRLFKIAQPETDELQITIKESKNQYRLLISASASLPLVYITENTKPSPLTAPNFWYRPAQASDKCKNSFHYPAGAGTYYPV